MNKVLAQDDIDALFAQSGAPPGVLIPSFAAPDPEAYNFGRAGQISSEQMKAISTVNDLFARNLMHTVGAWLRTEFQVNLVSGEQMPYAEYVERIPDPAFVCSIRLEPLGAIGLLEFDLALASPIVDLLLGGIGKASTVRQLTDIEELILQSVMQMIAKELNVAWNAVGLQFSLERRESGAGISRMMPAGEKTLCVCFEVRMPGVHGTLNLCLPAMVLNTILRRLVSERDRPRRRPPEIRARVRALVGETKINAVLQFPPVRLRATEIAALAPGSVLRLPVPRHAPAEIRIGGLSFARARPVRMGEHRSARIEFVETSERNETPVSKPVE